ncbi:MAG TPA: adenylyltransferase/cytidyltransferase family protein [Candidatus Acidoferrales bacterium]|nr:adenylyltransferase/cytidyltransferase family protein [Candidatus Acidoferrales bacterium]
MTQDEAILHVAAAKRNGRRVVFTYGCFDLLHPGHIRRLEQARSLGGILVVGIMSDAGVRARKGEGRPVVVQEERAEILCAVEAVDVLAVFEPNALRPWLGRLSPDIVVTRGGRGADEAIGREEVEAAGGRVVVVLDLPGHSTAAILRRIRESGTKDALASSSGVAEQK